MPNKPTPSSMAQKKARKEENSNVAENQNYISTYANHCELQVNAEEAVIQFGIKNVKSPTAPDICAKIYLNLHTFKRFLTAGNALIEGIEDALGEEIDKNPNARLSTPEAREKIQKRIGKNDPTIGKYGVIEG